MAEPCILALNTTFKGIAIGVYGLSAGKVEALAQLFEAKSHNAALLLPELTSAVLAQAGLSVTSLSGIAVAHGPGSFTGIKIGLAFVQGLVAGTAIPVLGLDPLACLGRMGATAYRRHPWLLPQNRRKGYLYEAGQKPQTVWLTPKLWLAPLDAPTADDPRRYLWPETMTEVGLVTPWQELREALPPFVATEAADPERFGYAALSAMASAFAAEQQVGALPTDAGQLKANYITPSTPEERQIAAALIKAAANETQGKPSDETP